MQLTGRVQVARPEPVRDDAARLPRPREERLELGLALGIHKSEDRDVVAGSSARKKLVQGAFGLECDGVAVTGGGAAPRYVPLTPDGRRTP